MRLTERQLESYMNKPVIDIGPIMDSIRGGAKKPKYNNKRVLIDGIKFDSIAEATRYQGLNMMQQAGMISDLRLQVKFELAPGVVIQGRKRPPLRYIADFTYRDSNGDLVVEDVKGMATPEYRVKRHLMKHIHGIDIQEIRAQKKKAKRA